MSKCTSCNGEGSYMAPHLNDGPDNPIEVQCQACNGTGVREEADPNDHSAYRRYIGDGVYVDHDGHHVVLTTEDGFRATNRVCLDVFVWEQLQRWHQHHFGQEDDDDA